jgi:hypothetical protein
MKRNRISHEIVLITEECCSCGVVFALPEFLHEKLKEKGKKMSFHCPNGHAQHYQGSIEEMIREEYRSEIYIKNQKIKREHEKIVKLRRELSELKKGVLPKRKMRRIK